MKVPAWNATLSGIIVEDPITISRRFENNELQMQSVHKPYDW